jgi:hypothetical protein
MNFLVSESPAFGFVFNDEGDITDILKFFDPYVIMWIQQVLSK